jgi:hypothetical protein
MSLSFALLVFAKGAKGAGNDDAAVPIIDALDAASLRTRAMGATMAAGAEGAANTLAGRLVPAVAAAAEIAVLLVLLGSGCIGGKDDPDGRA